MQQSGQEDQIIEAMFEAISRLLDPRAIAMAFLYLFGLVIAGVPVLRAMLVACVIFGMVLLRFGSRVAEYLGVGLLVFSMLVWIQLLPPIERWRSLIDSLFPA